jgi:hypothetical protein
VFTAGGNSAKHINPMFRAHPVLYSMVTGGLSPGVKWPGREVADSLPPGATIKNEWSYTSMCLHGMHRNDFTLIYATSLPLLLCAAVPVVIQMFLQTHVYNLCSYQNTPKYNACCNVSLHAAVVPPQSPPPLHFPHSQYSHNSNTVQYGDSCFHWQNV